MNLSKSFQEWEARPGDILAFCGYSATSHFINAVTYGIPFLSVSHVGILGEANDELFLFESTTGCDLPCAIRGRIIEGTQAHEPDSRLQSYRGKVWLYRLRKPLRSWERKGLSKFLTSRIGVPYDTVGAIRAGAKAWSWFESRLHPACLASLFCSEYCVAALEYIERFDTDHVSRWSPNAFIREGNRRAMFASPLRIA